MQGTRLVDIAAAANITRGTQEDNTGRRVILCDPEDIWINDHVQREANTSNVLKYIDNYLAAATKMPNGLIDEDTGKVWLPDGQHTSLMEYSKWSNKIEVRVTPFPPGLTDEEKMVYMSKVFIVTNKAFKKISKYTEFKNEVASGILSYTILWDAVVAGGCYPFNKDDNKISVTGRRVGQAGNLSHITNLYKVYFNQYKVEEAISTKKQLEVANKAAGAITESLKIFREIWPNSEVSSSVFIAIVMTIKLNEINVKSGKSVPFDKEQFKKFIENSEFKDDPETFYRYLDSLKRRVLEVQADKPCIDMAGVFSYWYSKEMEKAGIAGRLYQPGVKYD